MRRYGQILALGERIKVRMEEDNENAGDLTVKNARAVGTPARTEEWNKLSRSEQWMLNQKFLDVAISRGDTFYLASRWTEATEGSFFLMELEYLFSQGYSLSLYQNYLIPPSP